MNVAGIELQENYLAIWALGFGGRVKKMTEAGIGWDCMDERLLGRKAKSRPAKCEGTHLYLPGVGRFSTKYGVGTYAASYLVLLGARR